MPTYDYICEDCGDKFEIMQGINDSLLSKCKRCNGVLRRLIGSGGGFIFKGTGFYATDYKKIDNKKTE